jgi:acetoin utilization deacetylase AcuC-like enzyme
MGRDHPESPARVTAIQDYLLAHGILDFMLPLAAPAATRLQVERVHSTLHVAELVANAPTTGYRRIDADTRMNPHTLDAAWHAAGSAVLATELVAKGTLGSAFCNVRPAGHHATRDAAMGFCFFNNLAVGVRHALDARAPGRPDDSMRTTATDRRTSSPETNGC